MVNDQHKFSSIFLFCWRNNGNYFKVVLSFLLETLKNESKLLLLKEIFELNSNQMLNITLLKFNKRQNLSKETFDIYGRG